MSNKVTIRPACRDDVPAIIDLYGRDEFIGSRELLTDPLPPLYADAFDRIASEPHQILLVAEHESKVVGTLQLTFISYLICRAFRRALLESMFVHPEHHRKGIGAALVQEAIRLSTEAKCGVLELTSNNQRTGAHKFYESLGFSSTHAGFKLPLQPSYRPDHKKAAA